MIGKVLPVVTRVVAVLDVAAPLAGFGEEYAAIRAALNLGLTTAACSAGDPDVAKVRATAAAMTKLLEFYQTQPPTARVMSPTLGPTDAEVAEALVQLRRVR